MLRYTVNIRHRVLFINCPINGFYISTMSFERSPFWLWEVSLSLWIEIALAWLLGNRIRELDDSQTCVALNVSMSRGLLIISTAPNQINL